MISWVCDAHRHGDRQIDHLAGEQSQRRAILRLESRCGDLQRVGADGQVGENEDAAVVGGDRPGNAGSRLFAVTEAFAIAAPLGSVTVPRITPVDCARVYDTPPSESSSVKAMYSSLR